MWLVYTNVWLCVISLHENNFGGFLGIIRNEDDLILWNTPELIFLETNHTY